MGETSKKSGEIGEALAAALLDKIGWQTLIKSISIDCNTPSHKNEKDNPRRTHGEDQIFLYHSPFHDDRTDFVHVSDKNILGKYPSEATLKAQFKAHLAELHQTMECAKYSPNLRGISSSFGAKKHSFHSGLLVWLHNDHENIEKDIKPELANARLDSLDTNPIYVVDNERASFLLKVVDNLKRRAEGGDFDFYYPRIGTAVSVDERRTGKVLPLELIAADIIPALVRKDGKNEMILYSNENYESNAYKKLVAYGLNFGTGLVTTIYIGMPDFNPARHQSDADQVRMAFNQRTEVVRPFSFNRSILDLLQVQK